MQVDNVTVSVRGRAVPRNLHATSWVNPLRSRDGDCITCNFHRRRRDINDNAVGAEPRAPRAKGVLRAHCRAVRARHQIQVKHGPGFSGNGQIDGGNSIVHSAQHGAPSNLEPSKATVHILESVGVPCHVQLAVISGHVHVTPKELCVLHKLSSVHFSRDLNLHLHAVHNSRERGVASLGAYCWCRAVHKDRRGHRCRPHPGAVRRIHSDPDVATILHGKLLGSRMPVEAHLCAGHDVKHAELRADAPRVVRQVTFVVVEAVPE